MINNDLISDVLLDNPKVSNIICQTHPKYLDEQYLCCVFCDFLIRGYPLEVAVCVPDTWEKDLINVFIRDYSKLPMIPHVEKNGKICLFDLEGVLIDLDFKGLFSQCISRAIDILETGLYGDKEKNCQEFVREFSSYWRYLPSCRTMKCAIPENHQTQVIKFCTKPVTKHKRESHAEYLKRRKTAGLYASSESSDFNTWGITTTQQNGLFCNIIAKDYILPPDFRKSISISFVNDILALVQPEFLTSINKKIASARLIVFEIMEPNDISVCIAVLINKAVITKDESGIYQFSHSDETSIQPVEVIRIDKQHLLQRTQETNLLRGKKCLLIGCGSIGSYLCNELTKAGWDSITLVDNDKLKEENIYRHFLGIEYVDQYKTEALRQYFNKNIPFLHIIPLSDRIQDLWEDGSIDFNGFDIIISATGNHNVNRWLNKIIYANEVFTPVIYAWNEPLDVGCHVAVIKSDYPGCYECFFDRDPDTWDLYDNTAYCQRGQIITRNYNGCSGSFIPYGSTVSEKTVILIMDWIERILTNRFDSNVIISWKGDAYYFRRAGLEVSKVYDGQNDIVDIKPGLCFVKKQCEICGKQYDDK